MSKLTIVEGNSNDKDNVRVIMVKGEKGENGQDGISPIISVTKVNGIATITFTDEEGTKTIELSDGEMTREMVIDNLTSIISDLPLSANQGRILKSLIETVDERNVSWFYVTPSTTQSELQEMLDTIGAKIVEFEQGEYNFTDILHLNANTTLLLNNSTLIFSTTHGFFNFYNTDTPTLYNGNGNIKIINGTIKGGDISFCHANNVLLQNINFVDILNDHVLEIASCQNYVVDNCCFEGIAIQPDNRNYVECIQIDDMTRTNFPWFASGNNTPYDETPNNLIIIKHCTFKTNPEKAEQFHIYTCIGGHTNVTNKNKNIIIDDCYFTDWTYSAIRPYNWENVKITNCKFINPYSSELVADEFTHTNFIGRDVLSINISLDELIFENNYLYGTQRIFCSANMTEFDNCFINNNIFEKMTWNLTLNDDTDIRLVSTAANDIYIAIIRKLNKLLEFNNNNFINCEKDILRIENGYSGSNPKVVVNDNKLDLQYTSSIFHFYQNCYFTIMNNAINIKSIFPSSWGSLQNQMFRFLTSLTLPIIFKNNIAPDVNGLSKFDTQETATSTYDFSSVFDIYRQFANPNSSSSESTTNLYNRKFSDFNTLVVYLGNQTTIMTSIILTPNMPLQKLSPQTFRFKKYVGSEEVTGTFTIIDDTHFSFNLSNYRVKQVYGINL